MDPAALGLIEFLVFSLFLTAGSAMTNKTLFAILALIDMTPLALVLDIMAGTAKEIVGQYCHPAGESQLATGRLGLQVRPRPAMWRPIDSCSSWGDSGGVW